MVVHPANYFVIGQLFLERPIKSFCYCGIIRLSQLGTRKEIKQRVGIRLTVPGLSTFVTSQNLPQDFCSYYRERSGISSIYRSDDD